MRSRAPCVYILASGRNGTLYTGVTSNLPQRVHQHKTNAVDGFTKQHHVHTLVYYEVFEDMRSAIEREKQIKTGSRANKLKLIEGMNPQGEDLTDQL